MRVMKAVRARFDEAWSSPAASGAAGPRPRDYVLVAIAVAAAIAETLLRPELVWPYASTILLLAVLPALLWRRSRPLVSATWMVIPTVVFELVAVVIGAETHPLGATIVMLAIPYALLRWGSGRDRIIGCVLLVVFVVASLPSSDDPVTDAIAGVAAVGGACLIGALRRLRVEVRRGQLEAVRSAEREALARDLHDTVAHHVSAIAIRAQVAGANPHSPIIVAESVAVIESEAQAVLSDMRSLVRSLRAAPDYAPSPGIADLLRLENSGPPAVTVRLDLTDDFPELVSSTLFRMAQEGVTNARRHAREVTRIGIEITVLEGAAVIVVRDDGVPSRTDGSAGNGLRGMTERAALLGGEFTAGPDPRGGWTLRASLPLRGAA